MNAQRSTTVPLGWLAVVRCDAAGRSLVEKRLDELGSFYAPLRLGSASRVWLPAPGVLAAAAPIAHGELWWWGEPPPLALSDAAGVLAASDAQLRAIEGMTALVALSNERVRLVTPPAGPSTLHHARGDGVEAWSTHAVAAAWLATGDARLDPAGLPELLAFDFVGGSATLLHGARALDAASVVDLEAGGARERCYWPARERWEPLGEGAAYGHTEAAFLATLDRRVRALREPHLALTGGADSRAVATALAELGHPFRTFTWGEPNQPDVSAAAEVASALHVPHECFRKWLDDAEVTRQLDRDSRWSDGVAAADPAARVSPIAAGAVLGGMGGETGRCYYFRWAVGMREAPAAGDLLALAAEGNLVGAPPDTVERARMAARRWVSDAQDARPDGLRVLNLVYAEQRVRRWGRAQMPPLDVPLVSAFTPAEVAHGLSELPLAAAAEDGFQRRFIAERRPDIALPRPRRRGRVRGALVRRAVAVLGRSGRPAAALAESAWQARPQTRAWIAEDVLERGWAREGLGPALAERLRAGTAAGAPPRLALLLSGPAALEDALAELRRGRRP